MIYEYSGYPIAPSCSYIHLQVLQKSVSGVTNVTGIKILGAEDGVGSSSDGELSYDASTYRVKWKAPGDSLYGPEAYLGLAVPGETIILRSSVLDHDLTIKRTDEALPTSDVSDINISCAYRMTQRDIVGVLWREEYEKVYVEFETSLGSADKSVLDTIVSEASW